MSSKGRGEDRILIEVPPLGRTLAGSGALVAVLGLLSELGHQLAADPVWEDLVDLFSLSYEANLPTWYSSALLLACAAGLAHLARAAGADRLRWNWAALAALFLYFSIDEAVQLHERLNALYDLPGLLYFGWVIPAAAFTAGVGLAFLPFLRALPAATRRSFLVAGAVYVSGALLMELPLGLYTSAHGDAGLGYALIDFVEESLEITGATLFLLAVLRHAGARPAAPSPRS